jgi:hypothetical protein
VEVAHAGRERHDPCASLVFCRRRPKL